MKKLSIFSFILVFLLASLSLAAGDKSKKEIVIKSGGYTLGVIVGNVSEELQKEKDIEGGAKIIKVIEDSPAEKVGLQEGDIILEFDGKPVNSPGDLREYVEEIDSEKTVNLIILRHGEKKTFTVTLKPQEKRKTVRIELDDGRVEIETNQPPYIYPGFNFDHFKGMLPFTFSKGAYLGVYVEELTDQLEQYFGVDHGVLITKVEKESPAEKAGLKAGDVILRIGDKKIEDYQDLIRTVNYYDPGDKVRIEISRKGKKMTKTVELGKKKFPHYFYKLKPYEDRDEDEEGEEHSVIWFPERFDKKIEVSTKRLEKNLERLEKRLKNIDLDLYIF